jgi:hypothetical protein
MRRRERHTPAGFRCAALPAKQTRSDRRCSLLTNSGLSTAERLNRHCPSVPIGQSALPISADWSQRDRLP